MSEQIVKKLTGCPLVATLVGQQLWNEKDHMQWSSILNKKSPHIAVPSVMEVLKLSYQNLPPEVQICFRYCALFPPHYKFSMEELIDMWIGSGLILQRHEDIQKQNRIFSVEAAAREYFNLLERKSFLSIAAPGEDHYVMHALVYQLACSISSKEVLWLESADSKACVPPTVRHLSIEGINYEVIKNLSQTKELRLRTLVIKVDKDGDGFDEPKVAENISKLIMGSKSLRLLSLHGRNCSVLKIEFSKLKHLHYISMSNVNRSDLYKVFKLYHLEIIRIQSVLHKGKMGLSGIGNLLQLRKLDLPKGTVSRIRHIGRLTTLQELNGFSVNAEEGHKIDELRDLMRLQKVSVLDVQNVNHHSEANAVELHAKTDMRLLSLEWDSNEDYCDDDLTLENLSPNKDLKQLMICGYDGGIQPSWMNIRCLPNLVHLKLDGCAGWVDLPTLRILHTLRHLFLVSLYKLGDNDSFYVPIFRSRRRRDEGMGYIGDWMPPFLATLVVKECPALSKLPDLPLSLCLLDISQAGLTRLPTMCDSNQLMDASTQQPQLSDLHIESCQFLDSSLDDCLLPMGRYRALTNISVIHCKNLNSLPAASVFRKMSKMETVEIDDCESLSSLGGLGALHCLRELKIKRCPNLVASSSQFPSIVGPSMLLGILEVDKHALLHVKLLSDFNSTQSLVISDGLGMTTLPINWLERNIAALENIEVRNAAGLESLPLEIGSFFVSEVAFFDKCFSSQSSSHHAS